MSRKRTSIVWTTEKEEFKSLVATSVGYADALGKLGLKNRGNNFRTFKRRMVEDGLDYGHFMVCQK